MTTMNHIKQIFKIDKNPKRGLLPIEWLVMGYMLLTLLIVLFAYTRVENPQAMIWGRVRIAATTVGSVERLPTGAVPLHACCARRCADGAPRMVVSRHL